MNVHGTDRVNQAGCKAVFNRFLDAFFADIIGSLTSNQIIGFAGSAIQTETEKIHITRTDFGKDVMKQIPVGINRNGTEAAVTGISDRSRQIRMQRGLTT